VKKRIYDVENSDKLLILMRGVTGSGKTTLAKQLSKYVYSTDDYFIIKDGEYEFDYSRLQQSHDSTHRKVEDALKKGLTPVVVDNTNIEPWEMKPYVEMAMKYGYSIEFVEPDTEWKYDPKVLAEKNIHGVSLESIRKKLDQFEKGVTLEDIINSEKPVRLRYWFSTTDDGNMSFVWGKEKVVAKSRKIFFDNINIPTGRVAKLSVEHKDKIVDVGWDDTASVLQQEGSFECDAIVTSEKGLPIFLIIADCIPIIFFDTRQNVLAVAHGGIANTKLEFSQKVLNHMIQKYSSAPKDIKVTIGPTLRKEHFAYDYFDDKNKELWKGFVEEKDGKFLIDNVGATVRQLINSGIKRENIFDNQVDTYTDPRYFSHRNDDDAGRKDQGRFACVAMME
jgi:NEDD4-binding protein 2